MLQKIMIFSCVFMSIIYTQVSRRTPIVNVVEKISPSIVNISTERLVRRTSPFNDVFEDFFGRHRSRVQKTQSLGSGVIVGKRGFIVTNAHVIQRASQITVGLSNKKKYTAILLASDEKNDLALLKINVPYLLTPIKWGISSDIMIGETAIALGNPFGLESSVTTGVISAKNRSLSIENKVTFNDFVQTDAAINPGNSGGALVNIHSELIGINTAIYAQGQGLGFAIPIDRVRSILGKLLDYEKLKKYSIGFTVLEKSNKNSWSVIVKSVDKNKQNTKNKIYPGDTILSIDGTTIYSLFDFSKVIYQKKLGDTLKVRLSRNGHIGNVYLRIKQKKQKAKNKILWERIGVDVALYKEHLIINKIRLNGPAARISIKIGDVLVSLGQFRMKSVENANEYLSYIKKGEVVSIILIRRTRHLGGKLVVE